MAVIAGARELHQIRTALRVGFLPIMKVSWLTSPISLAFAQRFIPEHAWVPFFNIVGFIIGTYVNYKQKRMRMDAISKKVCSIPPDLSGFCCIKKQTLLLKWTFDLTDSEREYSSKTERLKKRDAVT